MTFAAEDILSPAEIHDGMLTLIWCLRMPPVEKMIVLHVLHFTHPGGLLPSFTDFEEISLAQLARDIGATVILTSKAISSLEARGVLKVDNLGRMIGGDALIPADRLLLTVLRDGLLSTPRQSLEEQS